MTKRESELKRICPLMSRGKCFNYFRTLRILFKMTSEKNPKNHFFNTCPKHILKKQLFQLESEGLVLASSHDSCGTWPLIT